MSNAQSVRSEGRPYFALVQENLQNMDPSNAPKSTIPSTSSLEFGIGIALRALPERLSSEDEVHVLGCYFEDSAAGDYIFYFGVTPNGRACMGWMTAGGTLFAAASSPGFLVADGKFKDFTCSTTDDGSYGLDVAGVGIAVSGGASAGRAWSVLGPRAGTLGKFMLLNGRDAKTKCECSLRSAYFQFTDSVTGNWRVRWPIEDGHGLLVARGAEDDLSYSNIDATLTAQFYNPLIFPLVWGTFPDDSPTNAFRWDLTTEWTKRTIPATVWNKRTGP